MDWRQQHPQQYMSAWTLPTRLGLDCGEGAPGGSRGRGPTEGSEHSSSQVCRISLDDAR